MPDYFPPPISAGGGGGTVTLPIAESDVTSLVSDLALKAPLASPTFTGTPTLPTGSIATTQSAADSSTKVATTAFTTTADNLKANLASPTFTGTPVLPTGTTGTTQSATDGSTKLATTAYTDTADALKANLASPTFTGTPTLPTGTIATTQSAADGSTKLATTAYTDTADALKANLASPTFTGTPTLPTGTILTTQATSDSSTKAASTAYVKAQLALPPDQFAANVSVYLKSNATYAGQFPCITALKPIFMPILIPGAAFMTLANLRFRISVLNSGQTIGMAIYSATYASSAHVSATLVAQLNAAASTTTAVVVEPVITTGAAGSGAAPLAMDFTTTRYLLGIMGTDVSTAKAAGYVLPAADSGLGVISWTGTARSTTTDWPSSFTEAASIAAISANTPIIAVDLLTATGAFFL